MTERSPHRQSHDAPHDTPHHTSRGIERGCDVAVIGGSAAGLAAALQLARQRRSVIVVDAGEPRNAPAAHMHSFLGREGEPPGALLAAGRAEVRSYGGEILAGRVDRVVRVEDGRFRVELAGGHALVARRVLAATGIVDELPPIEGLAAQWGSAAIHCPFCHGYEVRDQRIVQLITHPIGLHAAALIRQLSADMIAVVDARLLDEHAADLDRLRHGGVAVVVGTVGRVVTDEGGGVAAVELTGGDRVDADAIFVAPAFRARIEPLESLGVRTVSHPSGLGDVIDADDRGETSVPGVYAAGNVVDPTQQVLQAAADGSRVGAMIGHDLAAADLRSVHRATANETEWDARYSGDSVWSGNPNGTLVGEIAGFTAGRALDVGAGEGADVLWLAEQGWTVTATDVSGRALERVAADAAERGLDIACRHVDANAPDAYEPGAFDLVTVQYPAIPRTPDARGIRNLLGAVADGGTLLVVGHDTDRMRRPIPTGTDHASPSQAFDPDAYVGVEDLRAAITERPDWAIETFEKRPRPPGSATAAEHPDDVVLRARRHAAPPS